MGAYLYGVTAKSFVCKLNDSKVVVRVAKFLCRNSDTNAVKIQVRHDNNANPADLFVVGGDSSSMYGAVVYRGNAVTSFVDDYDLHNKIPAVGIVLGSKRKYYIETCERKLEKLRRDNEFAQMDAGMRSIGRFGSDSNAYRKHLVSMGEDYCRGYAPIS